MHDRTMPIPIRNIWRGLVAVPLLLAAIVVAPFARAHDSGMSVATVRFGASGAFEMTLLTDLEGQMAGIGPAHAASGDSPALKEYMRLRALAPAALGAEFGAFAARLADGIELRFDGARVPLAWRGVTIPANGDTSTARTSQVTFSGQVPAGAVAMTWRMADGFGDSVIRALRSGDQRAFHSEFATAGTASAPIALAGIAPQTALSVFLNYLRVGFGHIVPKGLDHILFVVGLFLLSTRPGALLWQVTGFTLAHSVSLALAMLGLVSVPAAIVEPLIAASIVYVAVENTLTDRLHRWRPFVVFGFGLLHGLGFAGVLTEIGLGRAHFVTGLVAFNLGVELGQLAVIAACFLAVGLWFRTKSWYRVAITVPASVAIAAIGTFWFVERVI